MMIKDPVPTARSTRKATSRQARPVRLRRTVFHLSCLEPIGSKFASSAVVTVVVVLDPLGPPAVEEPEVLPGTAACRRARTAALRRAGRRGREWGRGLEARGSECWVAAAQPG